MLIDFKEIESSSPKVPGLDKDDFEKFTRDFFSTLGWKIIGDPVSSPFFSASIS
jgi:hypothetical protein